MNKLFIQLVKKRKFSDQFLKPSYENCIDPFLLPDMHKAIERIKTAKSNREKVLIYGDYDVDGVTASALLYEALEKIGITKIEIMLPNRFLDGYGMSKKVVQRAVEEKIGLVITVDCGSRNHEIIEELNKHGVDTIVTDHHECEETLPNAAAVVNPKRKDAKNELLKDLAGVGVVFKLAQALVQEKMIKEGQEKWFLDLVLIGTICDSMKMTEENRRLCYFGLKVLKKTRRVGLKELMRVCQAKKVDSELIGFRLGPRLNAAGRMTTAEKALELVGSKDSAEAAKLAFELNELNEKRRLEQDRATREIFKRDDFDKKKVVVVKGKWHEGVLGIIAGKLVEKLKKPAIVFMESEKIMKGSGRSFGDFNLVEALEFCQDVIFSGGGHRAACGVKVEAEMFEKFEKKINKYYESLNLIDQEKYLEKKEDLEVRDYSDFSSEFIEELSELEPFSEGNEEPVFLLKDAFIVEARKMGKDEEHLLLRARDEKGNIMKLVAFYAPEEWLETSSGQRADVFITIMENEWNRQKTVEGRIVKMRLVEQEVF